MYEALLEALEDQKSLLSYLERELENTEGNSNRQYVKNQIWSLEDRISRSEKAITSFQEIP